MWWHRGSLLLQTIAGRWRQHDASTRHGRWPAKLLAGETLLQTLLVLLLECRHGGQLMWIAGRIVVVVAVVVVIVVVEVAVPC